MEADRCIWSSDRSFFDIYRSGARLKAQGSSCEKQISNFEFRMTNVEGLFRFAQSFL